MTQYLDWKVGDRVVCVDDNDVRFLEAGKEYTIAAIRAGTFTSRCGTLVEGVGIQLKEDGSPYYYFARRFRKVQPRKTSIAIFERLLNTQSNEVETA